MPPVSLWPDLLGVHQDLIWFLVVMGWSFAGLIWWRQPSRYPAWPWLPWAVGANLLTALLQFLVFNPPFGLFYQRLVPGTNDTYTSAFVDPHRFADGALAVLFAGLTAAWWWHTAAAVGARALRWPVVVLSGGLVWLHLRQPEVGGVLFALLPLMAVIFLWPKTIGDKWSRVALVFTALLPLFSTIGPLAHASDLLQRQGPTGWFGALSGTFNLLCASIALIGLGFDGLRRTSAPDRLALWHDARPIILGGLAWLVIGGVFALRTGYDNAHEVKTNRLRTTASRAAIFDRSLAEALGDWTLPAANSSFLPGPTPTDGLDVDEVENLRRELGLIVSSTPFLQFARFVVLKDDWLVSVAAHFDAEPEPPGSVRLLRPANDADRQAWAQRANYIEEHGAPEEGALYSCRAAVVDLDGQMLGWLDYVREEFSSTMERKWRTGPLLVTALGTILAGAFFVQRRGRREHEEALRAAAVATEAGRVKTAFLAKVSHELRTPLQCILGYSELLQSAVPAGPAQKQLAALRHHG